MNPKELVSKFK